MADKSIALPVTPTIPEAVSYGQKILPAWGNSVAQAIDDLWTNEQAMAAAAISDPTSARGDLLVRGPGALQRLAVGSDGQILVADAAAALGARWGDGAAIPGVVPATRKVIAGAGLGGGGALAADVTLTANVQTVYGRVGAITAQPGDYTAAMVTNAASTLGAYADPAWITAIGWAKITGAPATYPPSAHTHDAADIASGVLAVARLGTGTPTASLFLRGDGAWAAVPAPPQTPWAQDIDAYQYSLLNVTSVKIKGGIAQMIWGGSGQVRFESIGAVETWIAGEPLYVSGRTYTAFMTGAPAVEKMRILANGKVGIGTINPAFALDCVGDVNVTGQFMINGVPLTVGGGGSPQTPWAQDIDAASYALGNVGSILAYNTRSGVTTITAKPGSSQGSIPLQVWGDGTVDGAWGVALSGTDLAFVRRESGAWVIKFTFSPT
jgi:hypothetical protein